VRSEEGSVFSSGVADATAGRYLIFFIDPTFQLRPGFASPRPGDPGARPILRCAGMPHSFRTAPDVATETRSNRKCLVRKPGRVAATFWPICEAALYRD